MLRRVDFPVVWEQAPGSQIGFWDEESGVSNVDWTVNSI